MLLALLASCRSGGTEGAPSAGASASASASARPAPFPVPPEVIAKEVNPKGAAPYAGRGAVVRGVVRAIGPESPPADPRVLAKITDDCVAGRAQYERLFREGAGRALADVLVAVTGYDAFVPAPAPAVRVVVRDCAFEKRTVAAVFGQRIDVAARGTRPYMPRLLGAREGVMLVALPNGDPVGLYPDHVGRFTLSDHALPFLRGDVFVLRYATTAVTGLDGRFEIRGVPPGTLRLSAMLPATLQSVERTIELREGAELEQELELHAALPPSAAAPSASASSATTPGAASAAPRPR